MFHWRAGAALVMAVAVIACEQQVTRPDKLTDDNIPAAVVAEATADGIRVTNTSNVPLAFFAVDSHDLVQFFGCLDASANCLRLAPQSTVLEPYTQVFGFGDDTTEVTVYWWRVVEAPGGGYERRDSQSVTVKLR